MPNYQNSKIYKIWSPQTDEIYIGSTTQPLSKRMVGHRGAFKCYKSGKTNYVSSFKILEYGDARIELIRECPCNNKEQLRAFEGKYIRELDCVNIIIAGRDNKQYYIDNKEVVLAKVKEYQQKNKEVVLAKVKEYQQKNKEVILAYAKHYHQDNKEAIRAKQKQYYQDNKEAIRAKQKQYHLKNKDNAKIQCECGCTINKINLKRHQRTAKHKRLMLIK